MEHKKRAFLAALVAVFIVAAVFVSFAYTSFFGHSPEVHLASPSGQTDSGNPGDDPESGNFIRVEVTVDTVQSVIASLSRPVSYYREITVELWSDPENTEASLTTARTWADNGWTRSEITGPNGLVQYNLVGEDTLWRWYSNSRAVVSFPADSLSADLAQRIPTYEDILTLDPDEIIATGYEDYSGQPCIFVETLQPELDSSQRYWVSVLNGLLVAAERVQDGQVLYRMTSLSAESPAPPDSSFSLPDGTVLHTVGEAES